jgi:hypothetical protein
MDSLQQQLPNAYILFPLLHTKTKQNSCQWPDAGASCATLQERDTGAEHLCQVIVPLPGALLLIPMMYF